MLLIGTFNMYDYIHEPAQYLKTCLDGEELKHMLTLSRSDRQKIIKDWTRINILIFRTNPTKGNN